MKAGNIIKVDNYGAVCLCCIRVCDECISVCLCVYSMICCHIVSRTIYLSKLSY